MLTMKRASTLEDYYQMPDLKRCTRGEYKPIAEFYIARKSKDGLDSLCKEHRQEYRSRPEVRERNRVRFLKIKYGLTVVQYDQMWIDQLRNCYLCEEYLPYEDIVVDHDHSCCPGETTCGMCIRGLAHSKCNMGIGCLDDDPAKIILIASNLIKASKYVRGLLSQ